MATVKLGEQHNDGLYRSNLVAAFEQFERHDALAARIGDCASRAFFAIGAGAATQEVVYWNLLMTKNIARNELMDKPGEFIEGLKAIYGEAGTVVFEHMLRRELKREFGLVAASGKDSIKEKSASDLLHLIAFAALESQANP
jgi:hypothetical protein